MSNEIVVVPDIGADEVEVIEICVAVGDQIEVEQSLVVLESDKASMEVPSPMAGKVVAITLKVGDNVSQGAAILELAVEGAVANAEPAVEAPAQVEEQSAPAPAPVPAAVEPAAVAESKVEQVTVPDLGGAKDVECIEVCIAVGDEITAEQSLIVLETDKASMEIPSTSAGTVVSIAIKTGDTVNVGDVVLELQTAGSPVSSPAPVETAAPAAEAAPTPAPVADDKPTFEPETKVMPPSQPVEKHGDVYAGPAVRMLARDLGVDLTLVKGSGPRGRIAKEDLQEYVKARLAEPAQAAVSGSGIPAIPAVDFAKFGPVREEKLSKKGRVTAENMTPCYAI